jgi:hypothetical protein
VEGTLAPPNIRFEVLYGTSFMLLISGNTTHNSYMNYFHAIMVTDKSLQLDLKFVQWHVTKMPISSTSGLKTYTPISCDTLKCIMLVADK